MKQTTILLMVLFLTSTVFAGIIDINGEWLIVKSEDNDGAVSELYQTISFEGQIVKIMDIPIGLWSLNGDKLTLNANVFKKEDQDYTVLKKGEDNLVLKGVNQTLYLVKLDKVKVSENNRLSGIKGLWLFNGNTSKSERFIDFSLPDKLKITEKAPNSSSEINGKWYYFPSEKSVVLVAAGTEISGKYKVELVNGVLKLKSERFELTGKKSKALKTAEVEKLTFSMSDFFDEDGNYKYENEENKLPWRDVNKIISNLRFLKELDYKFTDMDMNLKVPKTKILKADINYFEEEEKVCVDYIFYGFDKNSTPEDAELPVNCLPGNSDAYLFPLKTDIYRAVKLEKITVPAGSFNCTVIEALDERENPMKLWMINDKPGVYAKIIMQINFNNSYEVYELEKIVQ